MEQTLKDLLPYAPLIAVAIAVGSLLISGCSLLTAILSARNASRALRISEAQEQRRHPSFSLRLIDSYSARNDGNRVYGLGISCSSQSDSPTSIVDLVLRVKYRTKDGVSTSVDISPTTDQIETDVETRLALPISIPPHGGVAGWIYFRLSFAALENRIVDVYTLIATDVHGVQASFDHTIFREKP